MRVWDPSTCRLEVEAWIDDQVLAPAIEFRICVEDDFEPVGCIGWVVVSGSDGDIEAERAFVGDGLFELRAELGQVVEANLA